MLRRSLLWLALCSGAAFAVPKLMHFSGAETPSAPPPRLAAGPRPPEPETAPQAFHTETYRVDARGQFNVTGVINGKSLPMVVDTGASLVSLTLDHARAIGIDTASLKFDRPMLTANGRNFNASITLYEVCLGQATLHNVAASVMPHSGTESLLGMSFLRGLRSFEIGDGVLTVSYY